MNKISIKLNKFYKKHEKKFDKCLHAFIGCIPDVSKKGLFLMDESFSKYNKKLEIFNRYLEKFPLDFIIKNTVKPWELRLKKI